MHAMGNCRAHCHVLAVMPMAGVIWCFFANSFALPQTLAQFSITKMDEAFYQDNLCGVVSLFAICKYYQVNVSFDELVPLPVDKFRVSMPP